MYLRGLSHSPVITKEKKSEEQCKPTEALPCENQAGDSIGCVSTKSSRNPSPVKIQIKLGDCDEECDLVIDTPPESDIKKRSKNYMGRYRDEELAAVDGDELHGGVLADIPKHTEEMSEGIVILQKNSRRLSTPEILVSSSKRAGKIYLPDVNTDTLEALKEIDALDYGEKKHVSSAVSVMGNMKKGTWKQENAVTKTVAKAIVHKNFNEDCEGIRQVTQSVGTDDSSEDEATTERPYVKIKTEESQRIEENRGHGSLEDIYTDPIYSLCKKESRKTLSLPTKELQSSGDSMEASESDDPLKKHLRILEKFESENQMEACDQAHKTKVLGTEGVVPEQKVHNKNEIVCFKVSSQQKGHAEVQQEQQEFADAAKKGQAFIDRTSEEKQITSVLSATQFKRTETKVQPVEIRSGQLHVLLTGNASTSMPCGYSTRPLKRATSVPGKERPLKTLKVSVQKSPSFPELESKVPFHTRQLYVNLFFSECLKICRTKKEALDKATTEEQSVFDSCGSRLLYLSYAVKTLKKLREHAFAGKELYELLKDYVLTKEQLNENNFPRPNPKKKGSAILAKVVKAPVDNVPDGMEKHYSCCERSIGSAGCQIAKLHVHNGGSQKLEGFVKTLAKSLTRDGTFGVYALDCEMCYTTHGLELTRVTVVDAMLQVVYDTFVKPDGKIVDYDQRLSGVREDDLKNTTSLQNVQAALLNFVNADTILIGHKLEKSFIALKLIHDTVVDTSIVFPNCLGLPKENTLQNLVAKYLRKIHQDDAVSGHNSKEEATACMELILWKVKEDNKK